MRGLALVAAGIAALILSFSDPALAHDHPSGISDLVTPAVVRIEATARIEIALIDESSGARQVERSYDVEIGSGSGIVVNPDGAIVTLTRVVKSDRNLAVYAANRIFAEFYKLNIPADFAKHTVTNDRLNRQLQRCYSLDSESATCDLDLATSATVFLNTVPPDTQGVRAKIVLATTPDSPAVLVPVGGTGGGELPTAPLAAQVPRQEGSPVSVAGLLGRPSTSSGDHVEIAHLGKPGTGETGRGFADPQQKVDEPSKLGELVDRGLLGGPVIGDKNGHVIGLLTGGDGDARMIGVREITSALQKAEIIPRRGPVDAAFEAALTRFHTQYYGLAVPGFQRVLSLSPGHVMAAEHLKTALAKRGGVEDRGAAGSEPARGTPLWPSVAAAALVAVALGGAVLLWARRTRNLRGQAPPSLPLPSTQPPLDEGPSATVSVPRPHALPFPAPIEMIRDHSGGDRSSAKYCTACGMQIDQSHRFCGHCGHRREA
ncbi:zinc ribbon domain-containing protein [Nonomuraea sp. NBC_00507]|uniref:zinc ribbon domain-containing protein n=1 Tax=Nonomuraea sp. NBC_00507 TaxID=2976002 RepID=UPI002E19507F